MCGVNACSCIWNWMQVHISSLLYFYFYCGVNPTFNPLPINAAHVASWAFHKPNLYGDSRYTSVHGFCLFWLFLMVGKGLKVFCTLFHPWHPLYRLPIMVGTGVDEWVAKVTPVHMVDVAQHRRRIRKKSRKSSPPLCPQKSILQLLFASLYLYYTRDTQVSERYSYPVEGRLHGSLHCWITPPNVRS